jgi:Protein of unknown function (DUF4058)
MPSPFPGMNPYLEQEDHWQDFHRKPRLAERPPEGWLAARARGGRRVEARRPGVIC